MGDDRRGVGRGWRTGYRRVVRRRHFRARAKRGHDVGKTKVGKGTKIEIVTDANGVQVGVATAAANIPETELIGPALGSIPDAVDLPAGVPIIADTPTASIEQGRG